MAGGGGRGGAGTGGERRFGNDDLVAEEARAGQATVPLPALGVEDPQSRSPPRRAVPVAGDECLGRLTDDVAAEPDPGSPPELETQPGRLGHRRRQTARQPRRFEDHEERLRAAGEGCQAADPIRDLAELRSGSERWSRRQVHDEDVHRATGQEHPGDRQALVEGVRRQDDEPVETDAASDGLDRVEGLGEIEPGDDRAAGLGLGDEAKGECRDARAWRSGQGDAGAPRQSARPEDRVELREAGPDDPLDAGPLRLLAFLDRLIGERRRRQRSHHPRSCHAPPRLEGRHGRRHVRGKAGHEQIIEQMFYYVKDEPRGRGGPLKTLRPARTAPPSVGSRRSPRRPGPRRPQGASRLRRAATRPGSP